MYIEKFDSVTVIYGGYDPSITDMTGLGILRSFGNSINSAKTTAWNRVALFFFILRDPENGKVKNAHVVLYEKRGRLRSKVAWVNVNVPFYTSRPLSLRSINVERISASSMSFMNAAAADWKGILYLECNLHSRPKIPFQALRFTKYAIKIINILKGWEKRPRALPAPAYGV